MLKQPKVTKENGLP